jgi:hypothetical protein
MSKPRSLASPKKPKSPPAPLEELRFWRRLFSYFLPNKVLVGEVIPDEPVVVEKATHTLLGLENESVDTLNDLKIALITMVKECSQPRWYFEGDKENGVGNLILKVRKNKGISAIRSAEIILEILQAHHIPVTRQKTLLTVSRSVKIDSIEIADRINEVICERFRQLRLDKLQIISETEKKLRVTEELDSDEDKEEAKSVPHLSSDSSARISPPLIDLSSPESKNATLHSKRKNLAQSDSAILSPPSFRNHQRSASPTLFSPTTSPRPRQKVEPSPEPIVWNVKGETIVYDPAHPELSDVHPIMSPGGRQFLLFTLVKEDFTKKEVYKKMKAISDIPTVARQHGNQGVVFLTKDEAAPPVAGMTQKQREAYGVIRAVDGTQYIPSVKLKILGEMFGDVRAYGYEVKNPTHEVLNVVDAVDEHSHKRDERRKKK